MEISDAGLDVDPDFSSMLDRLFADLAPRTWSDREPTGLDRDAWRQVDELGVTLLTTPEDRGGSGARWPEMWTLHRSAARHGVALPLGEHDLLGRWLADRFGWTTGDDVVSVGVARSGRAVDVPWGADVDTVLLVEVHGDGAVVSRHASADLTWSTDGRLPTSRRARTRVPGIAERLPVAPDDVVDLRLRGALLRSVQIVGALERCVDLAVEHAAIRVQFGRPLLAFQAVQGMLADAASETALARAAVAAAIREADAVQDLRAARTSVAVAKSCSSHAVGPVTRAAHQVLGAIGTTREHDLHRFSMPALGWRGEFGTGADWDAELGASVDATGLPAVWHRIVDGLPA
ncbi:acyl-CoA dehydrogenase family protein [Nocardioides kongjuensis]|uniref:Acyl-CoA dehydrogenase n=1 Tax=Nocardioides kongjuensis TaxID=349522 RepID=A0A852RQX6_9ACTN|nr:acyl-CoA dehydrogenase family protein [Nocardioides kongjuensis]NYD33355.1 acyl-CoA dehydrogenase [Nocardioides kongjuensis]